jgi:hypothetical protein
MSTKATWYVRKEQSSCRLNQTFHTGNTWNPPTSLIDHPVSQPNLDISPIWTPVTTADVKYYNSIQCRLRKKICVFYVGTIQRIYLSSDDFYSDSTLVLGLIRVELFNVLMFCLNSHIRFVLCLVCILYLVLVQVSKTGTNSIDWAQLSKFYLKI